MQRKVHAGVDLLAWDLLLSGRDSVTGSVILCPPGLRYGNCRAASTALYGPINDEHYGKLFPVVLPPLLFALASEVRFVLE
jgi:hypothetical protein